MGINNIFGKIILGATLLCLAVSMGSCKLESTNYDTISSGNFPSNIEDVEALIAGNVYYCFSPHGIFLNEYRYIVNSEMVTDIGVCSWGWNYAYNSYEANDELVNGDYRNIYQYISYFSSMTLTRERIKNVSMSDELMSRYIAEINCGLGFLGFLMYDCYGPVQIADLETMQNPQDEKIVPRLSEEAMREYIESHLLSAYEDLPYAYDSDADYGRFTKGVALAVLMKFYMMTERWDDAEEAGRELSGSAYGYRVIDNYDELFALATEKNDEVIWSSQAKTGVVYHKWHAHALPANFPTPAGMTVTKWGGYKVPWPFYNTFEAGDKRLNRLVGEYTSDDGVVHNETNDRDNGNTGSTLYLGAVPVKYAIEGIVGETCEIDMPIFRFADIKLLLAEAIARNGNRVTQEAVNLVNEIRTRAGLDGYELSDFPAMNDFMDAVLLERGHELYWEGHRRQDLIRHGKFIEKALEKARWAGENETKIATQVDGKYKYERFPLPPKYIQEGNGIVEQNPGF